jgi:protein-disulfide isomerase
MARLPPLVPPMSSSSTRHRIALVIAFLGLVVSGVILYEELQLSRDPGHSSFCNVGGAFNCDVVLASRYGEFLDVPLGVWAIVAFLVGGIAAMPGAFLGIVGGLADLVLIAMASGALGFALVLAGIMATVLQNVCLLCLTLDVVIVAWVVTVLPLAGNFAASAGAGWLRRRTAAYATAAVALVTAFASGALSAVYMPAPVTTAAEIQAREPEFATHYLSRPSVAVATVLSADAASKGRADAPVTIVEFSDFQCPACAQAFTDLHELLARRTDVRLVFRNFPLDSSCNEALPRALHPNACLAAMAGECARKQSRFWEYHDRLFENQRALERDDLFRYAREVGLDIPTFRTCLDARETKDRVADDIRAGIAAGIESTPTLFINGRKIDGALERPFYDYALVLEQERGGTAPRRP